jgi:WD40 repeat protein
MRLLPVRSGHIERLAYSPDGRHLAASANPWARVWLRDLRAGEVELLREAGASATCPLAYSPSGHLLAFGGVRHVHLRDNRTGVLPHFRSPGSHQSDYLAFVPDGRTLVSAGYNPEAGYRLQVVLWDVRTGRKREFALPFPAGGTQALAISPDASVLLCCEPPPSRGPARLSLWHVPGRQRLSRISLTEAPACAAFSTTGRRLAVAIDNIVLLYEIGHIIDFIASLLGSGTWAGLTLGLRWKHSARLVPMANPQPLEGHEARVQALAFSPDGGTLFSGGRDGTVRCWDLTALREREAWSWPVGVVYSLAVAPDGLTAAAGGNAGRAVVWDLE